MGILVCEPVRLACFQMNQQNRVGIVLLDALIVWQKLSVELAIQHTWNQEINAGILHVTLLVLLVGLIQSPNVCLAQRENIGTSQQWVVWVYVQMESLQMDWIIVVQHAQQDARVVRRLLCAQDARRLLGTENSGVYVFHVSLHALTAILLIHRNVHLVWMAKNFLDLIVLINVR